MYVGPKLMIAHQVTVVVVVASLGCSTRDIVCVDRPNSKVFDIVHLDRWSLVRVTPGVAGIDHKGSSSGGISCRES